MVNVTEERPGRIRLHTGKSGGLACIFLYTHVYISLDNVLLGTCLFFFFFFGGGGGGGQVKFYPVLVLLKGGRGGGYNMF